MYVSDLHNILLVTSHSAAVPSLLATITTFSTTHAEPKA